MQKLSIINSKEDNKKLLILMQWDDSRSKRIINNEKRLWLWCKCGGRVVTSMGIFHFGTAYLLQKIPSQIMTNFCHKALRPTSYNHLKNTRHISRSFYNFGDKWWNAKAVTRFGIPERQGAIDLLLSSISFTFYVRSIIYLWPILSFKCLNYKDE